MANNLEVTEVYVQLSCGFQPEMLCDEQFRLQIYYSTINALLVQVYSVTDFNFYCKENKRTEIVKGSKPVKKS